MKSINTIKALAGGAVLFAAGMLCSCGDHFQPDYPWMIGQAGGNNNNDSDGPVPPENLEVLEGELKGAIPFMINYSHEPTGTWAPHKYQYYRTNSIDGYAGYWTPTKATFSFGGPLPNLYTYPNDYLGGPSDNQIFTTSWSAIHYAEDMGMPAWKAIALIIQAYSAHEIVDFYGTMPLTAWRKRDTTPPLHYERGDSVYMQLFRDLDEAKAILRETQPTAADLGRIEDFDQKKTISQGDYTRWIKFANCIQLRMAMNIVKWDPAYAQNRAEAAVADGVLTADELDLGYYHDTSDCCLYFICNTWHDIRVGASIENILKHFNSPLLNLWFDGNSYAITDRQTSLITPSGSGVFGIRAGINMLNLNVTGKDKGGYGPFGCLSGNFRYMHQDFFKRAEAYMLRAEGALRGWAMGGTAKEFYETAIRISMIDNGVEDEQAIEDYINQEDCPRVDYEDPFNSQHNIQGRVLCNVKWDDNDSQELKLEKIITQKYIANFPMGAEAWTNFRRTGYPRLFPPYLNDMPGVDTELQIRRIPAVRNTDNYLEIASMTEALEGEAENAGVRVFWDIPTEERGEVFPENGFQLVIPKNF